MQMVELWLLVEVSIVSEYLGGGLSLELGEASAVGQCGTRLGVLHPWHERVTMVGTEGSVFLDLTSFYPCTPVISILASKDFIGALDKGKAVSKAGRGGWVLGGSGSRRGLQ